MKVEAMGQIVRCDVVDADATSITLKNVVVNIDLQTLQLSGKKAYGVQSLIQSGGMFLVPDLVVTRGEQLPYDAISAAEAIRKKKGARR